MLKPLSIKTLVGLITLFILVLLNSPEASAQNEVAIGSATTKSNAILWLNGNGSQGLILPVVTNKTAVSNPDKGMVVYDDSDNKVWYRNSSAWVEVGSGTGAGASSLNLLLQGNQLQLRDGTTVQSTVNIAAGTETNGAFLVFTGGSWQYATLSGDVTGTNGALQVNGIKGKTITTLPATAQALVYDPATNGGAGGWVFQALPTGTTLPTLNNGQLLTGNGTTNTATTITGEVTLSGSALTINDNAITTSKINANAVDATKLADNSVTSLKIADAAIGNADISPTAAIAVTKVAPGANGQVLTTVAGVPAWSAAPAGTVTSVTAGTGLTGGTITNSGTVAVNVGTGANQIPQLDGSGKLNVSTIPTGVNANQIVQLDGTGKLPAVDGSQLTNLPAATETDPAVKAINGIVKSNGTTIGAVVSGTDIKTINSTSLLGSGNITVVATETDPAVKAINGIVKSNGTTLGAVVSGTDIKTINSTSLLGSGNITVVATETDPAVRAINGLVKSNGTTITAAASGTDYQAPLVSGTNIKTINGTSVLGSGNITAITTETDPAVKAINGLVKSDGTTISSATPGTDYLTPTGNAAGLTGLTAAQIPNLDATKITTGTLPTARLDAGVNANQLVQLDGTGRLPAIDGSQLTNLPAGTETDPSVKAINGLVKSDGTTISSATPGTDYLTPTGSAAGLTNFPILNQNTTGTAATITGNITESQVTNLTTNLANKVTANTPITGATNTKITYDSKGLVTGGTALTASDLPVMTNTVGGAVPTPPNNTTTFLRGDGTFAAPPTGGTVTTVSVTPANGISGTVATPTTTPAISLTLGAITPTSVAATGTVTGSNLSGTNTGDEIVFTSGADGLVPAPGVSTGRVLRDDGTWATPAGSGDMLKSTYDANSDNVVDLAATVTTNANLTGPVTSVGNATSIGAGAITNAMLANSAVANLSGINTGDQINITGNAATVTTNANLTGPVTSIGNTTAIANGAITNAMLANGAVANLSGTNTGDEVVFTSGADGLVPAPGVSTGRVLRDDGTWATPAGTGDMLKSTYDANSDNVVDLAATVTTNANLTGPVTSTGNATAIANGAITNAMLANGAVANLSGTNTGDEATFAGAGTSGIVPDPGTATGKVLRDDGTWVTPAGTGDMLKSTYDADSDNVVDLAATVTTNANLTGPVTSTGNATSIANGAITNAMLANGAVANLSGTNTGDQTITLTGDVTGTGTGSFTTTLATVPISKGGTGATTASQALTNLGALANPMTTAGDIIIGGASGAATRLAAPGTNRAILGYNGTTQAWITGTPSQLLGTDGSGNLTFINQSGFNPMTTAGDIIYGGAGGSATRLPGGAAGVLKSDGTNPTWGSISLPSSDVSGTLPTSKGGTGLISVVPGGVAYGGATDFGFTAAGTAGQILQSNGTAPPSWINAPAVGWSLAGNTLGATEFIGSTNAQPLRFSTASTERMRIDAIGNVGIGTTNPRTDLQIGTVSHLFDITGGTVLTQNMYENGGNFFHTAAGGASTLALQSDRVGFYVNSSAAADAAFGSSLKNRLVLTQTGLSINKDAADPSAVLQVVSETSASGGTPRGFMMPSMIETDRDLIPSPLTGLAIFNQTSNRFEYYNGTGWQTLGGNSWGLTGNAGTLAANSFIGTTDSDPLIFKVNGVHSGRIDPNGNTFFGYGNGQYNTGSSNTGFGVGPFFSNTTGLQNVAVGTSSFQFNTSGNENTAVGFGSMQNNSVGSRNVAIGTSAIASNLSGNNNTGVGFWSLLSNSTGTNNTALGYGADVTSGALTNATAIGYNAKVGASNSLVLGGTGADAVNVGIGTTTPTKMFEINNSAGGIASLISSSNSGQAVNTGVESHTSLGTSQNIGVVGYGEGTGSITNYGVRGIANNSSLIDVGTYGRASGGTGDSYGIYGVANGTGLNNYGVYGISAGATNNYAGFFEGTLRFTGALGLGTGSGSYGNAGQVLTSNGSGVAPSWTTISGGSGWDLTGNTLTGTERIGSDNAQPLVLETTNTERMRIDATGNVGIGTTTPQSALDVNGNVYGRSGVIVGVPGNGNQQLQMNVGSGFSQLQAINPSVAFNNLALNPSGGNVGIGTTTPAQRFHINEPSTNQVYMRITNSATTNGINIGLGGSGSAEAFVANNENTAMYFQTNATNRMTIAAGGNVGIGTINPNGFTGKLLHLSGTGNTAYILEKTDATARKWGMVTGGSGEYIIQDMNASANAFIMQPGVATNQLVLQAGGNVGIGTGSPQYPLDVNGSVNYTTASSPFDRELTYSGEVGLSSGLTRAVTIRSSNFILSGGFLAFSDKRIKENFSLSNSSEDLNLLMRLNVTDYHFKDKLKEGSAIQKGFIAQEVKEVIPEAVNILPSTEFVPSVYAQSKSIIKKDNGLRIDLAKVHDLKVGDRVRLYDRDVEYNETVIDIPTATSFTVKNINIEASALFVYGKEITDLHTVDYDRIYTLGISAIQELNRKLEAQQHLIDSLQAKDVESKKKIAALEASLSKVAAGETELAALKSEIEKIKAALGLSVEAAVPAKKKEQKNEE